MIETNRLELTIPISEEDLLHFLLSRYDDEHLARLGISHTNSIIREVQIEHDVEAGTPKCNFRVCALTIVNTEEVLEKSEAAQKKVIDLLEKREIALQKEIDETGKLDESASGPTLPQGGGGCIKQQIAERQSAMRVSKQKKSSNS